jgi:hypothetical protein
MASAPAPGVPVWRPGLVPEHRYRVCSMGKHNVGGRSCDLRNRGPWRPGTSQSFSNSPKLGREGGFQGLAATESRSRDSGRCPYARHSTTSRTQLPRRTQAASSPPPAGRSRDLGSPLLGRLRPRRGDPVHLGRWIEAAPVVGRRCRRRRLVPRVRSAVVEIPGIVAARCLGFCAVRRTRRVPK